MTLWIFVLGNKLYAIKPDGTVEWSNDDHEYSGSLTLDHSGTIYVSTGNNDLCAITPDGDLKWILEEKNIIDPPAVGNDGTLYAAGDGWELLLISPYDGKVKWETKLSSAIDEPLTIGSDGTIYASSRNDSLTAIKPDGEIEWSYPIEAPSSPAIGNDGTLYVAGMFGDLYSVTSNGDLNWGYPFKGIPTGETPVIGKDGVIYVSSLDKMLYAIKPDGKLNWSYASGSYFDTPAIAADGTLYVGLHNGGLYALTPEGDLIWSFSKGGTPAISKDGTLYFGSSDGSFYAIESESGGLADTPWPMYQKDLSHSGSVNGLTCTFNIFPESKDFLATGGTQDTQSVKIEASSEKCVWTVSGIPSWISVSAKSGIGSSTVDITAKANAGNAREITLLVAGKEFKISQAGFSDLNPIIDSFSADSDDIYEKTTVLFNCKAHDPDGGDVSYLFKAGDGSDEMESDDGSFWHQYNIYGIYNSTCTAIDDELNQVTSNPMPITVRKIDEDPIIDDFRAEPTSIKEKESVTFTCEAYDPDGGTVSYLFKPGDGSEQEDGDGIYKHPYNSSGNFDAQCIVTDDEKNSVTSNKIPIEVLDKTAPSTISNLSATTGDSSGTVNLTWTAPGDDGNQGTADHYEVKYHSQEITSANWDQADPYDDKTWSPPKSSGSAESRTVSGLTPGQTYYFAVKGVDEAGNKGGVSNSPPATAGSDENIISFTNMYVDDAGDKDIVVNKGRADIVEIQHVISNQETSWVKLTLNLENVPGGWTFKDCFLWDNATHQSGTNIRSQYTDLGGGNRQIQYFVMPGSSNKLLGIQFKIPEDAAAQDVTITSSILASGGTQLGSALSTKLKIVESVQAIIVTNRDNLYEIHADTNGETTALLNKLFAIADGNEDGEVSAVVYYADRYNSQIASWDNQNQNLYDGYPNNEADVLDGLLEGWAENLFDACPQYIMIVGGDEILPFYRKLDSTLHGIANENGYTDTRVSSNNYYFIDSKYADLSGNDYDVGEVEACIGRIVGNTPKVMYDFIANSLKGPQGDNSALLASMGGNDVWDVDKTQEHLEKYGFDILNDQEPEKTVETATWTDDIFGDLINNQSLKYVIASAHGSHYTFTSGTKNTGTIHADTLNTNDFKIAEDMNLRPNSRPFFILGGCHNGLLEDTKTTQDEYSYLDATSSLTLALVNKGISGLAAFTTYGYYNGYNNATGPGEELQQDFFSNLNHERSLGQAFRLTKLNFDPWNYWRKKNVQSFILYGVPWASSNFPALDENRSAALESSIRKDFTISASIPTRTSMLPASSQMNDRLLQTFSMAYKFTVDNFSLSEVDAFDLVNIVGSKFNYNYGEPVLPEVIATLNLPKGSTVGSIKLLSFVDSPLGSLNIPICQYSSSYKSRPGFTDETELTGLYPEVQYRYDMDHYSDHVEVKIYFIPVQTNLDSEETTLFEEATLEVQYNVDQDVFISDLQPSKSGFNSTEKISMTAKVENAGSVEATGYLADVKLFDQQGNELKSLQKAVNAVAPGGSANVQIELDNGLDTGNYMIKMSLLDPTASTVVESSAYVKIYSAYISKFQVPAETPNTEENIPFTASFHNGNESEISVNCQVKIYNNLGQTIATLTAQSAEIQSGSTTDIVTYWCITGKTPGKYRATASVTAGSKRYSANSEFVIKGAEQVGIPTSITVPASSRTGVYTVSWGASSITGVVYVLEESTNSSFTDGPAQIYAGSKTTFEIGGRTSETTYYYRVKATKIGYADSDWQTGENGCVVSFQRGTLQFDTAVFTKDEGLLTATIKVTRLSGDDGSVGVSYATSNGTATAGEDYEAVSDTISWSDLESGQKEFKVQIIDDGLIEGDETVNLTLSDPTGGATLGSQASAVLTILDDDAAKLPLLTTSVVENISARGALCGGDVTSNGGSEVTERGVCWSTSTEPTTSEDSKKAAEGGTGEFSVSVTGLEPNTQYHVRAYAINSVGTAYGDNVQFNTPGAPTATTGTATSVENSSAVLNGTVNPNGVETMVWFDYGTTNSYGSSSATQSLLSGTGAQSVSATLSGLSPEITYHFRTRAYSIAGEAMGGDSFFKTGNVIYVSLDNCGTKSPCYECIQLAIDAAADGSVIKVKGGTYEESLSVGGSKSILIKGGYDSKEYDHQIPNTTIIDASGATIISPGSGSSLKFDMISVQSLK